MKQIYFIPCYIHYVHICIVYTYITKKNMLPNSILL